MFKKIFNKLNKSNKDVVESKPEKVYYVERRCECGGMYRPSGRVLLSNPPKYPHHCTRCDRKVIFDRKYPCIVTRKED